VDRIRSLITVPIPRNGNDCQTGCVLPGWTVMKRRACLNLERSDAKTDTAEEHRSDRPSNLLVNKGKRRDRICSPETLLRGSNLSLISRCNLLILLVGTVRFELTTP